MPDMSGRARPAKTRSSMAVETCTSHWLASASMVTVPPSSASLAGAGSSQPNTSRALRPASESKPKPCLLGLHLMVWLDSSRLSERVRWMDSDRFALPEDVGVEGPAPAPPPRPPLRPSE